MIWVLAFDKYRVTEIISIQTLCLHRPRGDESLNASQEVVPEQKSGCSSPLLAMSGWQHCCNNWNSDMPNPIRQKAIEGLKAGDSFTYSRTFQKEETEQFGDMIRDYNPVHYDLRWAKSKGFDRLICHGLLVGSMICEFGGQVGWLATGMSYKFIKPVYFDEKIICTVTITKIEKSGKAEAEALFFNDSGEKVCRCLLTGRLPQSHERILLAQMITEGDPTNKLHQKKM